MSDDVRLVNCGASTALPPATMVRVTFVNRHSFQADDTFAAGRVFGGFESVYQNLKSTTKWGVQSPNTSRPDINGCVEDLQIHTHDMDVATMLRLLDGYCGFYIRVAQFELLGNPVGDDADEDATDAQANTPAAQEARDKVITQQKKNDAADSLLGKVADNIGTTLETLKWVSIVIVIVVLIIVAAKARHEASALLGSK